MNIATILTAALIITNAACLFALVCAWEGVGYWKQEAQAAEALLHEAQAEIDDDNVIIAWQRQQIAGHIRDNSILLAQQSHKRGEAETELAPGEMSEAVDAWLAEGQVQP